MKQVRSVYQLILVLAWGIALLISLLVPTGYFLISYQYLLGTLDVQAEMNARAVTGVVMANPGMWRYEIVRLSELMERRSRENAPEIRSIIDSDGQVIVKSADAVTPPLVSRQSNIYDAGQVVAHIRISRSMTPLLTGTAIVALGAIMVAALVFIVLRTLPLRIINRAYSALGENEKKFRAVFELSPITMALNSYPEGTFHEVNRSFSETFGFSQEEALGRSTVELNIWVHPPEREGYLRQLRENGFVHAQEAVMRTKSGDEFAALISGGFVEIGSKLFSLNAVVNINEQKRMEKALHASEMRFRSMLEQVHQVAVILDREGNITFCNDFLLSLTGWSHEEVIKRNWFDFFIPEVNRESLKSVYVQALAIEDIPSHLENAIITRNGDLRTIVWDNTLLKNAEGDVVGAASLGMDISEHRSTEMQLLQSQKMEAIGQLAGGVAHDFNNLLTPILGYADMIKRELSAQGGKVERVDRVIEAALKARDLIRHLLSFGRKQILDMQVMDLNSVVTSFAGMLHRTIRENIDLQLALCPGPAIIRADRTQIEQIIMNLVINAQHAIPGTGFITLETSCVTLDENGIHLYPELRPGDYVLLTVIDSGHGMDSETLNHIFEPFYTTKDVGEGTGLGLSTVFGIVKQHEGYIRVHSGPGEGAVFELYFPHVTDAPVQSSQAAVTVHPVETDGGTILLVEDNTDVRAMIHDLLADTGYHIIDSDDPRRALAMAEGLEIDLLLSDVIMPGMNGPEMYQQLLSLHPGLKVLFMSGYTDNVLTQYPKLVEASHFIQKPFDVAAFKNPVAELLGK